MLRYKSSRGWGVRIGYDVVPDEALPSCTYDPSKDRQRSYECIQDPRKCRGRILHSAMVVAGQEEGCDLVDACPGYL